MGNAGRLAGIAVLLVACRGGEPLAPDPRIETPIAPSTNAVLELRCPFLTVWSIGPQLWLMPDSTDFVVDSGLIEINRWHPTVSTVRRLRLVAGGSARLACAGDDPVL
jgi:hypothetical protein